MTAQRVVIIHGKKIDGATESPRAGRPECELWGVTRANCRFWKGKLLDWTRWCDVHPLVSTLQFPGIPDRRPDAWAWYKQQDGTRPIYLMHPDDHPYGADRKLAAERFAMVPGATRFPIREIQARFRLVSGRYPNLVDGPETNFVEQTGMMIAHALLEGFDCIILNGVGQMSTEEFIRAHLSIPYWIAAARFLGVPVLMEGKSSFASPSKIYAFQKLNYEEYEEEKQRSVKRAMRAELSGMLDANLDAKRRGRPPKYRLPPQDDLV